MRLGLRTLIIVVSLIGLSLAITDQISPFHVLKSGDSCTITAAKAHAGPDFIQLRLKRPFAGKLKSVWFNSSIGTSPEQAETLEFNAAWKNSSSFDGRLATSLAICFENADNNSVMNFTTLVSEFPSVEQLRSLTTVDEFADLLGDPHPFSDSYHLNWRMFTISSDDEIEVMTIQLIADPGRDVPRVTDIRRGTLKTVDLQGSHRDRSSIETKVLTD